MTELMNPQITYNYIDQMLDGMLDSLEAQHPFASSNFLTMNRLVFLWVIGKDDMQIQSMMKRECKKIIDDERTICMLSHDPAVMSSQDVYADFSSKIQMVASAYMNVDLYKLLVCPVFLPGCFENEAASENFTRTSIYLMDEMRKRSREITWTPFFLIRNEEVGETKEQMKYVLSYMDGIISHGRQLHVDCCCPCCVFSDVNERGQEITREQIARNIVMLTVFRNTSCENETPMSTILDPIALNENNYFFTARAISICEPVKSLALNRILAVNRMFQMGEWKDQTSTLEKWNHQYFRSEEWKKTLENLPHDGQYRILTAPVYSNIPEQDQDKFRKRLEDFCRKYYLNQLQPANQEMQQTYWKYFCKEYFMEAGGAVRNLDDINTRRMELINRAPNLPVNVMQGMYVGDMRRVMEQALEQEIKFFPRKLIEHVLNPDGMIMVRLRNRKEAVYEIFSELENCIKNKEKRMRQNELLLNTGGGHIANPLEEAEEWLRDYGNTFREKVWNSMISFQAMMSELFESDAQNLDDLSARILDLYYKLISGSIETRQDYMKNKLINLANSDMGQLIGKLGENWLYPVRIIGKMTQDSQQKLFVMGSSSNLLCARLLQQENYKVTFKQNKLDDRLEIVRVSERFNEWNILGESWLKE